MGHKSRRKLVVGAGMALVAVLAAVALDGCMSRRALGAMEAPAGVGIGSATGAGPGEGRAMAMEAPLPAMEAPPGTPALEGEELAPSSPRHGRSQRQIEHGQLTAGDWDDNLNFPFYLSYLDKFLSANRDYPHLSVSDRAVIVVRNAEGRPVSGARVVVSAGIKPYFAGTTAADGRVLFVPALDGASRGQPLTVTVDPPADQARLAPVRVAAPAQGSEWRVVLPDAEVRRPWALDLAFVVDTTGSMSDELEYLKAEIQGISDAVKRTYGEIEIRYALVTYRDHGDIYVTRTQDFTNLANFRAKLNVESAGGGGDAPEAMDEAAVAMNELSWRPGNVARVAFLVTDAPAHRERAMQFLRQADLARKRGIRLYTVAASGVDDQAEFLLRQAAELTLARYVFLTDDSGIGNSHAEPHIPCYQVQLLSNVVARMLRSELTGVREEAHDVIRTVGNPQSGVCKKDNQVAYYY